MKNEFWKKKTILLFLNTDLHSKKVMISDGIEKTFYIMNYRKMINFDIQCDILYIVP